jgi:hypothetical protein
MREVSVGTYRNTEAKEEVYRNTCENLNTQLLSEISHASCLLYFEV